jgi:hypothetical protein
MMECGSFHTSNVHTLRILNGCEKFNSQLAKGYLNTLPVRESDSIRVFLGNLPNLRTLQLGLKIYDDRPE